MRRIRVGRSGWAVAASAVAAVAFGPAHALGPTASPKAPLAAGEPVIANIAVSDQLPPVANSITDFGQLRFLSATSRDGLPGNPTTPPPTTPLVSLVVQPSPVLLSFNTILGSAQQQLRVTGTYQDGSTRDLSSTSTGTTYSASGGLIGVTNAGIVFANASALPASGRGRASLVVGNGAASATIDVTVDAFSPKPVKVLAMPGTSLSVLVRGSLAFVSDGAAGLTIVDVSSKSAPHIVSTTNVGSPVHQVALVGPYAYLAAESKLVMLDVSHPEAPQVAFNLAMTNATGIQLVGNYAYVADGEAGLRVISLNPFPTQIVATRTAAAPITAISGAPPRMLAIAGNQTLLFDATLASSPSLVGATSGQNPKVGTAGTPSATLVSGIYGYVANGFNGVVGLDLRAAPVVVGGSDLVPATFNATGGLARSGNLLFATDSGGSRNVAYILSLLDPANPTFADKVDFASLAAGGVPQLGIEADRQYVYVTRQGQLEIGQFLRFADTGTVAPAVSITSPAEGARLQAGANASVVVDATDDVAVASVALSVDGIVVGTQQDFPLQPFLAPMPAGASSATLRATATDFNGNSATSEVRTVELVAETTPPVTSLQLTRPERTQFRPGEVISLNAAATDNAAVVRLELYLAGALVDSRSYPGQATVATTFATSSATIGATTVELRAIDSSGNVGSAVVPITISAVPAATISTPTMISAADTYLDGTALTVSGTTVTLVGTHTYASIRLTAGAVLTQPPMANSAPFPALLVNADNLTVDAGSWIDVSQKGPLICSPHCFGTAPSVLSGGDELDPNKPGQAVPNGRGGGIVRIRVTNTFTLNGTVAAYGSFSSDPGSAAGSIRIDTDVLTGSGIVIAEGGNRAGNYRAGSAGGRIAIYYRDRSGFNTANVNAMGGYSPNDGQHGGAGTIFWKSTAQTYGDLVVDNRGRTSHAFGYTTQIRAMGAGTVAAVGPSSITATGNVFPVPNPNGGEPGLRGLRVRPNVNRPEVFRIVDNNANTLFLDPADGDATLVAAPGSTYQGVWMLDSLKLLGSARLAAGDPIEFPAGAAAISGFQGALQVPELRSPGATTLTSSNFTLSGSLRLESPARIESTTLEVTGGQLLAPSGTLTIAGSTVSLGSALVVNSLTLQSSVLTHPVWPNGSTPFRLTIQANDLYVDGPSRIDVSARGPIVCSPYCFGEAPGVLVGGSEVDPSKPGQAVPFGRGGGIARIQVATTFRLDGTVAAYGSFTSDPGTAAGSIRIDTDVLTGAGVIIAEGGNRAGNYRAGSAGGRIAIYYRDRSGFNPGNVVAMGGYSPNVTANGSAGTIYWKTPTQANGDMVIDNRGRGCTAFGLGTNLRAVGSGTVSAVSTSAVTVSGAPFPVPNPALGDMGLRGLRVRPNASRPEAFHILDNNANTLFLDPADGNATLVAAPGDTYRGVWIFDNLSVVGNARAQTGDRVEVQGTTSFTSGSAFSSVNLVYP